MKSKVFQIKSTSGMGLKVKPKLGEKYSTHNTPESTFPEIKPVYGIMPDSKEEYWVALALWKLKLEFRFQYQVMSGRSARGGQVIDFLVYTAPLPTMVMVQGYYFHYGTAERKKQTLLNIEILRRAYDGVFTGPVELFDRDMPTPDMAYALVKKELLI